MNFDLLSRTPAKPRSREEGAPSLCDRQSGAAMSAADDDASAEQIINEEVRPTPATGLAAALPRLVQCSAAAPRAERSLERSLCASCAPLLAAGWARHSPEAQPCVARPRLL